MSRIVNDCRLDREDRPALKRLREIPKAFKSFSRPEEVLVDWHKTENQGPIGSCAGNALASIIERLLFARGDIPVTQLSRIFAYLATQRLDGLLGRDNGSTISGGVKLAMTVGVPPEALTGYPRSYPGSSDRSRILAQSNYDAGKPYKALSKWAVPTDPEEAKNWIGGGGGIHLGIKWGGMPRGRVFTSFSGSGGGGHAVAILGYRKEGNLIGLNSHGDGPFEITPSAWVQMIRHSWTAAIGLAGAKEPEPFDFTKREAWIW